MDAITFIAEERIKDAQARGEFDNLPGLGKPLLLGMENHIPEDIRMAYTLLKNAGFLSDDAAEPSPQALDACLPEDEKRAYGSLLRLEVFQRRSGKLSGVEKRDSPARAYQGPVAERVNPAR